GDYRLLLCEADTVNDLNQVDQHMRAPENVIGTPLKFATAAKSLVLKNTKTGDDCIVNKFVDSQFPNAPRIWPANGDYIASGIKQANDGFYLIGPPEDFPNQKEDPLKLPEATLRSSKMNFQTTVLKDGKPPKYMVVLQRLACPYLDHNPLPLPASGEPGN